MFTILPSLYFVAVHYFRRWNVPHYDEQTILPGDEEEKKASNAYETYEHGLSKTSFDKQSLERIEKCDTSLLRSDPTPPMTDYYSLSRSEFDEKKNSNVLRPSQDEDNRPNQVKLRPKRPDRSSSSSLLLNTERRKTYTGELTDDDTVYLMDETGFTREQILLWHSDFLRDCPDGKLSKNKFIDIYKQFYQKGQVDKFCEHAFRVFDEDGSGYIDFVEFLIAVSMTSTKDPVRKTELFFSMYDIDRNGLIDENEMRCVVESIYELMGIDTHDSTRIDMKVREIFAKAECDQSGYLRKDQFALACKNDRYIRKLLVPNTKAPTNS